MQMRIRLRRTNFVLLGLFVALYSQESFAENCTSPNFALQLSVPVGQKLSLGPIEANLVAANLLDHTLVFAWDVGMAGPNGRQTIVKVWSNDGNLIEMTPFAEALYNRKLTPYNSADDGGVLSIGGTASRSFSVSKYYQFLRPGSYSIYVKQPDFESDSCLVVSNVVKFEVLQ